MTYGQIVADELGVDIEDVKLVYGDTRRIPFSLLGTGGSSGGPIGGGAVKHSSRRVCEQVIDKAADLLEADRSDIDIIAGNVRVAGVPARGKTLAELAELVVGERSEGAGDAAFEAVQSYRGKGDGGWSVATHACIDDVDLDTGKVTFPRYLVVEDCGPIINPAIVDGQVRGGVAQGIGAVLYERATYDDDANLQSATYMDHLIPTSIEIPDIEVHHMETLSPGGENDYRGVGEGGMIGAPAAITNAIEHALSPFGVRITSQHLPPTTILELAGVISPDRPLRTPADRHRNEVPGQRPDPTVELSNQLSRIRRVPSMCKAPTRRAPRTPQFLEDPCHQTSLLPERDLRVGEPSLRLSPQAPSPRRSPQSAPAGPR